MERHLYRRTVGKTKTGNPIRVWYYWYYDPKTKKQVRKSCGTSLKHEAEAYIGKLAENDREYLAMKTDMESLTIAKMAENMFADDSTYLKRRKEEGYLKEKITLREVRGYLNNFIIKNYGHLKPEEIDPAAVDDDLLNLEKSGSWRNRAVTILNWILDEAVWLKMIKFKPKLRNYKRNTKKKSVLSQDELSLLFPDDFDALSRIWDSKKTDTVEGFMFGALFALMTSTGLRNGEARAISPSQLVLTDGKNIAKMAGDDGREAANPLEKTKRKITYGLIVDRMYNQSDKIVMHLKKGDEDNRKTRIAVMPEKTAKYLKHWLKIRPAEPKDLLFSFQGRRLRGEYVMYRLDMGLKNAGINTEDRILKPHSLRYTYNTKMRRRIPVEKLRLMIGHDTAGMTDYYTLTELEEEFLTLRENSRAIDGFWGQKPAGV
jgi:integrase